MFYDIADGCNELIAMAVTLVFGAGVHRRYFTMHEKCGLYLLFQPVGPRNSQDNEKAAVRTSYLISVEILFGRIQDSYATALRPHSLVAMNFRGSPARISVCTYRRIFIFRIASLSTYISISRCLFPPQI